MQTSSINLPSSVFASEFEEEVGLLNKAAPVSGEIRISLSQTCRTNIDFTFVLIHEENQNKASDRDGSCWTTTPFYH